jgi:hypothetical protein
VRGDAITPFFKTLTVERRLPSGVRSESYEIGTEGILGSVAPFKWNGNRLVIETGSYSGTTRDAGPYREHDEVWSLEAQGRLLITVTDRGSSLGPSTTDLTYRRR